MIFGEYPCCEGELTLAMPDQTPAYAREECPYCGTPVWHKFSRIQSTTWTEEEFLKTHDLDYEKRTIQPKDANAA